MHIAHLILLPLLVAVAAADETCEERQEDCEWDFDSDYEDYSMDENVAGVCRAAAAYRDCLDGSNDVCARNAIVYPQKLDDAQAGCAAGVDYLSTCGYAGAFCDLELQENIDDGDDACDAAKYVPSCLRRKRCEPGDSNYPQDAVTARYTEYCGDCADANERCKQEFDAAISTASDRYEQCGATITFKHCREAIDEDFCSRDHEDFYNNAYNTYCAHHY